MHKDIASNDDIEVVSRLAGEAMTNQATKIEAPSSMAESDHVPAEIHIPEEMIAGIAKKPDES